MNDSYAIIKFNIRAEIAGIEVKDIVQFGGTWEVNTIPFGSLQLAVGRNVKTQEDASIHKLIKALGTPQPVKVYIGATVIDEQDAESGVEPIDGSGHLIFDGYAVGTGWVRGESSARFSLGLSHWLSDMHYSSAISASSHPGNPGNWSYPAVYGARQLRTASGGDTGSSGKIPVWTPMIQKGAIDATALNDIWGNIIHKWMQEAASKDPIDSLFNDTGGGSDQIRDTLAALARMGPNREGVPLALDDAGADRGILSEALRAALNQENGTSWQNTTLWGKLVTELSAAYSFDVIPRVSDALIVPSVIGLRATPPWGVLGAEDYTVADTQNSLPQLLRAVGILFATGTTVGSNGDPAGKKGDFSKLAGKYPSNGGGKGLIMLKDPPGWLSDYWNQQNYASTVIGTDGKQILVGNVFEPPPPAAAAPPPDPAATVKSMSGFLDAYAHQWYVIETLRNRCCEISGKVRFDIAPGSTVKIVAGSDKFITQDGLAEDLYATVTRISLMLDAENQNAGTAFSLAHIRTATENKLDAWTVEKPPMYKQAWKGASLLPNVTPEV